MASEWVGLSVLMDLLGTDANGVRRVARDAGAKRYKLGEVEVYDKEAFFGALDKKADKVKKRTLSKSHLNIIRKLGKTSGYCFNKEKYLRSKEMLVDWRNNFVLKNACALIELKKNNEIDIEGDHAVFTFSVSKFRTLSEDMILTFKDLIDNKIIL